jgi:hypothetical protein
MWTTSLFLLSFGTAGAQSLQVNWSTPARYQLQSQISTPRGFRVYGEENLDARLLGLRTSFELSCESSVLGRGWEVDCVIDEVGLVGSSIEGEEQSLSLILEEFQSLMQGAMIQIQIRGDGKIKAVDLEGPPKDTKRQAYMHEQMRQILRRTVSPLDMQTPKGGEDPGKKWKMKGMHLGFELMSTFGTAGGTRYEYTVDEWTGAEAFMIGSGRGTVGTNLEMDAGSGTDGDGNVYGSSSNPSISMIVVSQMRFDSSTGTILYSELNASGESTAQSMNVGATARYAFAGFAGRIYDDGSFETLDAKSSPPVMESQAAPLIDESSEQPDASELPEPPETAEPVAPEASDGPQ